MGFVQAYGCCVKCRQPFAFNPMTVPSIRVNGEREPICRACVEAANPIRIANGLQPIEILPDAYEACDEADLEDVDDEEAIDDPPDNDDGGVEEIEREIDRRSQREDPFGFYA